MNEIELAAMVDEIEALVREGPSPAAPMVFIRMTSEITEHEAALANAEWERRGLGARIERVEGWSLR